MKQIVLIADRDAVLCDIYRRFLTRHGYEVRTASDGLDCLKKIRQQRPDVLMLDLDLLWGGSDGVLGCLSEEGASSEVPVILTSTAVPSPDIADSVGPLVVNFLPKPIMLTALLDRVRAAADLRQEMAWTQKV